MILRAGILSVSFAVLTALAANAQPARTFVSSTGIDTNPCSRTAPCRNFAAAVAAVADRGEVIVLDSAGYGPVSITKSVSIIAPGGVYAGITATSGDAIAINDPAGYVALGGLTLNGLGASYGIDVLAVGRLSIDSCSINSFSGTGMSEAGPAAVTITNSVASSNATAGFLIYPATGSVTATIDHCRAEFNGGAGFAIDSVSPGTTGTVRDSVSFDNGMGFLAYQAEMNVKGCAAVGNFNGVDASTGGTVTVSESIIADNTNYGFVIAPGGVLSSYGTNEVTGNGNGNLPNGTISTVSRQ